MWYENDQFWLSLFPFIFDAEQWAAASAEVERIVSLLGISPPASVLDLCCGPGRHSLELARRGFSVVGVDRTTALLDELKRRSQAEQLQIEVVHEDMRGFSRAEGFEAILNVYTSFGYFPDPEDDRGVLLNLHRSLKPGGTLLIDVLGKEVLARDFCHRNWRQQDGTIWLR